MKKLTKKEVNQIWGDTFQASGFNIAKSYIMNGELFHCFRQHGEGMDEALYNKSYDISVDLKDIIMDSDDMYKSDFISSIHCEINDMIERYNSITKDDAESYFIYDIDEDVTENFNKERFGRILSAQQASTILGVSTARIYTLLKEGRIGSRESGISYDKVIDYKNNRKAGRPIGSYKRE